MIEDLVKKIEPSVVQISAFDSQGREKKWGSGFIVTDKCEIVTNRHVLQDACRAEVKLSDDKIYPVKNILAEDVTADLLMLDLQNPPCPVSYLHVSEREPEKGERVLVIGNPLGFEKSVSDGIVSGVREIPSYGRMIQITAPISPGSSGSPVVNLEGDVIGVATAQTLEGQNLNFAIPAERVINLIQSKDSDNLPLHFPESPETAETLFSTGESYLAAKDYEKAILYYEKAIERNSEFGEAYVGLGAAYLNLGEHQAAIEALTQAVEPLTQSIRIKPDNVTAYRGLGLAYFVMRRFREAIDAYSKAVELAPDNFDLQYELGMSYSQLGSANYGQATAAYFKAARLKPDDAAVQCEIATKCAQMNHHQEAVILFKKVIRIEPNNEAYTGLMTSCFWLGIQVSPGELYKTGDIQLNSYSETIKAYRRTISVEPRDSMRHQKLGLACVLTDDKRSAIEEYKILEKLDRYMAEHLLDCIKYNFGNDAFEDVPQDFFSSTFKQTQKLEVVKDVRVKSVDDEAATKLLRAAHKGQLDAVEFLLREGVDVNAKYKHGGTTALIFAAAKGHAEIVKMLLDKGADVTAKTDNGLTALLVARRKGHKEIVRLLKAAGARG